MKRSAKISYNVKETFPGSNLRKIRRAVLDNLTALKARIALEKGRTAAETRRSTANWQERVAKRIELLRMPEVTPVQGGVPIVIDGTCVGAVGVSGVQSHEDEQIAAAGIKALG